MRKNKIRNCYDDHMKELTGTRASCAFSLTESATKAYLLNQTLSVYPPDSPDYNSAKKEIEFAQRDVRCRIGSYDSIVAEIKNYYEAHEDNFEESWAIESVPSHELIYRAIKNLLTRG